MAKKKFKLGFKVIQDGRTSCTFALIYIVFFVLDTLILKGKLNAVLLSSPTAAGGDRPFVVSEFMSYLKILLYPFSTQDGNLFMISVALICMFGPAMEERYGSIIIAIMMVVSTVFSGVLTACFCKHSASGPLSIIYMLLFLNAFFNFSKKKIPLSFIFEVVFIILIDLLLYHNPNGVVGVIVGIAGGLCGSLFAFLASPKARVEKKNEKTGTDLSKTDKEAYLEELDSQSPRFKNKKNKKNDDDDDTTVVGTLTF